MRGVKDSVICISSLTWGLLFSELTDRTNGLKHMADPVADPTALKKDAPAEGVKPAAENAQEPTDYLKVLEEKDGKIAKLQSDLENYRVGIRKYKKLAEDNPEDKSLDEEKVKQMISEALLSSQIAQEAKEKDDIIKKIAKENSEMRIAMQNKSQISNIPEGSSQPQDNVTQEKLSEAQKAQLTEQARLIGTDPAKFIENFLKNWNSKKQ